MLHIQICAYISCLCILMSLYKHPGINPKQKKKETNKTYRTISKDTDPEVQGKLIKQIYIWTNPEKQYLLICKSVSEQMFRYSSYLGSLKLAAPALLGDPDKHKAESFLVSSLRLHVSNLKRLRWGPPLTWWSRGCPLGQARPLWMTRLVSWLWMLALTCHGKPHATCRTCFPTLHSFLGGVPLWELWPMYCEYLFLALRDIKKH